MRRLVICLMCLCLLPACALAYAPGEKIDVGFASPVEYLAGVGEFMLVRLDPLGLYLLGPHAVNGGGNICSAMPDLSGAKMSLSSDGPYQCDVIYDLGDESIIYHLACVPTEMEAREWILERYERRKKDSVCTADFSYFRADMTQTVNGKTEQDTVYYDFFRQAYNLNHDKMPDSIEEARMLEEQYPVAAVSPSDPNSRVNLREGPSTKEPRCGSLYSGAMLMIREITKDGWAKIYIGDTDAYISTQFLTFGAEIEHVPDRRPKVHIRDDEWVGASRRPFHGGGGSVVQVPGGQDVRLLGEYNGQWRIVDSLYGSYYIEADDVRSVK